MLRNILFSLFLCCIPLLAHAQSRVALIRNAFRVRTPVIHRTIETRIANFYVAKQAAFSHNYTNYALHTTAHNPNLTINIEHAIHRQLIKSPTQIYGPYNYVRAYSSAAKIPDVVHPKFVKEWKHINDSQGYNGAHHLVNKYTIKMIHADLKAAGQKVSINELQANAPAIYHPLHGNPLFQEIFHDAGSQYGMYNVYGMKYVIEQKLFQIDQLNDAVGLPKLPNEFKIGVLREGELWSRHNGLMWEPPTPPFR